MVATWTFLGPISTSSLVCTCLIHWFHLSVRSLTQSRLRSTSSCQQVRAPEEHVELGKGSVTLMLWLIPPLPRYQRGDACQPRDQPRCMSKVDLDHGYDLSA